MISIEPNLDPRITVADFVLTGPEELQPTVLSANQALDTQLLTSERIQKFGLALTGFTDYLRKGRLKVVGKSEISYLSQLSESEQRGALSKIDPLLVPCILITKGLPAPRALIQFTEDNRIPLLLTNLVSSRAISLVTSFLQEKLAPQITIHAVLMKIYGIGVLLLGESGIGKSECALDLISRGHALISDDSVLIKRIGNSLVGDAIELTRGHLEIRGLGIVNASELFGVSSVGQKSKIELSIELRGWDEVDHVERIGLEIKDQEIFDIQVPSFTLPVSPARNLSTLVETAVRVFLLKRSGSRSLENLIQKHNAMISGCV